MPKQDKLQKIAEYFGVTVDYLMGIERDDNIQYYLNDETKEIAQEIFDNNDLKILFDARRKATVLEVGLERSTLFVGPNYKTYFFVTIDRVLTRRDG